MDRKDILTALEPLGKETQFLYELGRFICAFAMIETAMHGVLRRIAGTPDPKGMAIFGGTGMKEVLEHMRRLIPMSLLNSQQRAELLLLIGQVHVVSQFRNALIHRGATAHDQGFLSVNTNKARTFEALESLTFKLEDVRKATEDLECIEKRAWMIFAPQDLKNPESSHIQHIFAPWRYKALEPSRPFS